MRVCVHVCVAHAHKSPCACPIGHVCVSDTACVLQYSCVGTCVLHILAHACMHVYKCMTLCACVGEVKCQIIVHVVVVGGPQHRGLSGGEKKRLSLACELALQANIFLLDVSQQFTVEYVTNSVHV